MRVFRRDLIESNWTTGDMHRFLGLYFELIGARVIQIPVRHRARKFGKSKYSLRRFLQLPGDLILLKGQQVVLRRPVHFFFALAFPLWVISLALIFFAFFLRLSGARPYLDTTLILGGLLLFVTGLIILSLGFFSEIIIRLLFSNNQRTHFIVKELI
jgi:amino acid transporter